MYICIYIYIYVYTHMYVYVICMCIRYLLVHRAFLTGFQELSRKILMDVEDRAVDHI